MSDTKKLAYREIPTALKYVIKTLWGISPAFVVLTFFGHIKNKLVPFVTLFIAAAVTSRLPALVNDRAQLRPILLLVGVGVSVEFISRLFELLTTNFQKRAEVRVSLTMREHFYRRYAGLPYHLYEDKSVIDAFNYADEFMYRFSRFGMNQIAGTLANLLELVTAFVSLVAVAWFLPIALVIFLPLLVRSALRLNREQTAVYKRNRPNQRRVWSIESYFYPRKIKESRLYGTVDYFLKTRRQLMGQIRGKELDVEQRQAKLAFIQDAQVQIAGLVASAVALYKIAYQGSPLGIFVLAQSLTARAGYAVQNLFNDFSTFDSDLYGFAEYRYITEELPMTAVPGQVKLSQDEPAALQLDRVSFRYPEGDGEVLKNIDLSIPPGASLAIVGENGAGKTTLIKLLLGLYQPNSGEVRLNGRPLADYDNASWLSQVGILLQDYGLNEDIQIREAIWLGDVTKPQTDAAIWEVLSQAELKTAIKKLPHGLDTFLGKWIDEDKGTELSGGQLQRLAIARVLFRDPEVLIMDEPTSAIDANAEERIFDHLHQARRGKTTIFISHRFSTVRRADRIVFMHAGRIAEQGTHEELMRLKGRYHEMFTKQSKGYK